MKFRKFHFIIFLNCIVLTSNAQTSFTDIADDAGINHIYNASFDMGGGVAIFDYNNDDLMDIYYTGGKNRDILYKNNGDNTFSDVTIEAGLEFTDNIITMGVVSGDIDNDGDRDLFLTTLWNYTNVLLENNGNGSFTDITSSSGIGKDSLFSMGASLGDYNKDGFIDLYVGNYIEIPFVQVDSSGNFISFDHLCYPNSLFHNNGDNTFTDVSLIMNTSDSGCNLATTFTDYDSDGDIDILNANDFGAWVSPNVLYQNNFPDSFSNVSFAANMDARIYGMGIAAGDYDHDMDLDYYITNIGQNILHQNNGNGNFTDLTHIAGIGNQWVFQDSLQATGWGTGFMDIDNDSYLDLYVANGYIDAVPDLKTSFYDPDKLYHNAGDGSFKDISESTGINANTISRGFAYADFDNDGDVDLFPVPIFSSSSPDTMGMIVYRNDLVSNNNWLKVSLEGTTSNRDAFGSQILIYTGEKSWVHEISGGSSHCSQHSSIAHFGLGDESLVDSLVIKWTNGHSERFYNVTTNQILHIIEGQTTSVESNIEPIRDLIAYPNPADQSLFIKYNLFHESDVTFRITNVNGQLVWSHSKSSHTTDNKLIVVDVNKFQSGIYLLSVITGHQIASRKIIIKE
ncbi:MAG: VCBS repeat-containing protein [Bacteroidia bacterium]|nr:VCBS repeat-containing protein [Bacteroidia bacterium]